MPIGANSTHPETWKYHYYGGTGSDGDVDGFIKFIPDDNKHYIVGEARLANSIEQMGTVTTRFIQ